jgi:methionyl-tRNA formyltransferase
MSLRRIVYMASAGIAVPVLDALAGGGDFEVVAVLTQPDRPAGRQRKLTPCPVKARALALGQPVLDPEKVGEAEEALRALQADIAVVFAYGQYIPKRIVELPALGSINLHPSLLPKYRGASPIQSAIAAGETTSGISVLRVSERMDAGELFAQRTMAIGPDDDSESFGARCATEGGALLLEVLCALRDGTARPWPQDEALATETRKLEKEDGLVDWSHTAEVIANRVRAYQPWPGVFTGTGLKLLRVRVERGNGAPGSVLSAEGEGPLIACGKGALRLLSLQPPGKGPMDGRSFLNGRGMKAGDLL